MDGATGLVILVVLAVVFFVVKEERGKKKVASKKPVASKPKAPTVAELKKLMKRSHLSEEPLACLWKHSVAFGGKFSGL